MSADRINYLGTLQTAVLQVIRAYNYTTALFLAYPNAEHSRDTLDTFDVSSPDTNAMMSPCCMQVY